MQSEETTETNDLACPISSKMAKLGDSGFDEIGEDSKILTADDKGKKDIEKDESIQDNEVVDIAIPGNKDNNDEKVEGKRKRKRARVSSTQTSNKTVTERLNYMHGLVRLLYEHPNAESFKQPVDTTLPHLKNYRKVVLNPQDLGTILNKFKNNEYKNAEKCMYDLKLVFMNCYAFFKPGEEIISLCHSLEKIFLQGIKELNNEEEEKPLSWTRSGRSKRNT